MHLSSTYWHIILQSSFERPIRIAFQEGPSSRMPLGLAWCITFWSEENSEQGIGIWTLGDCPKLSLNTCKCCRGKSPQCSLEMCIHFVLDYKLTILESNGMLYRMAGLLTQTTETDTLGFYFFSKWWLWKRYFIFWQCWGIERQSGRGNHGCHTSSKSYTWCSLELGFRVVLTQKRHHHPLFQDHQIHLSKKQVCEALYLFYLPSYRQEWQKGSRQHLKGTPSG